MSDLVVSKCGIHNVGAKRTGYGEFCQTIKAAGRRLSLVKCRDDFGAIDEPLLLWPETVTIGARTEFDGGPFDVQQAYNNILSIKAQKPALKYIEYLNEVDGLYSEQADLYIALMPLLAQAGIGLCMFNCASGTPRTPGESVSFATRLRAAWHEARAALSARCMTARVKRQFRAVAETPYEAIARACKYARDNDYDDVILGLHEYQSGGGTIERHNTLTDYLEARDALIPIAITEYGLEVYNFDDAYYMQVIKANDPEYMRHAAIIGCALWTLGGGGWGQSNYQTMLPALGEYIATVEPIIVPPPVDLVFSKWLVLGAELTANPLELIMPNEDVSIVAVYVTPDGEPVFRNVIITTDPAGNEPRLTIEGVTNGQAEVGKMIRITAT